MVTKKQIKQDTEQLVRLISGRDICIVPEKLNLLGENWDIQIDKDLTGINGNCSLVNNTIKLKPHKHMDRTLIHEVIHARDKIFGWKINTNKQDTETQVRLETNFWLQLFNQIYPVAKLWKSAGSLVNKEDTNEEIDKLKAIIDKQVIQITTLKTKLKELKYG